MPWIAFLALPAIALPIASAARLELDFRRGMRGRAASGAVRHN